MHSMERCEGSGLWAVLVVPTVWNWLTLMKTNSDSMLFVEQNPCRLSSTAAASLSKLLIWTCALEYFYVKWSSVLLLLTEINFTSIPAWTTASIVCEYTCLHVCVRRKLHFELYDKVHMPNIAARPCGIYHDLYKVHYQPKSVRLAVAEHIQHVYPKKCWYGSVSSWEIVSQTHSCDLSTRADRGVNQHWNARLSKRPVSLILCFGNQLSADSHYHHTLALSAVAML